MRDRQRQVAERRPLGTGVGERDVVGDERAGGRQVDRVRVLGDVGHGVDQLVQLVQRGGRALHRVVQLAELLHRVEQAGQPQHERGDRADGDRAAVHHPPADADDDGHGEHPGGLDQPEVEGADLHRVQVAAVQRVVALVEAPGLLLLTVVRLDDTHAGDALLQRAQVLPDLLAHVEVGEVAPALEAHRGDGQDRHDDEHGERQLPADHQHHQDRDDDEQTGADELQQAPLDQLAHALDVRRHPGHEHARLVAVVVGHRLGLQPLEDTDAQLAQEALAGDVDRQVLLATEDVVGDHDGDVDGDDDVQRRAVAVAEAVVGGDAHQQWAGDGAQRDRCDEAERGPDRAPVRLGELDRAAHHRRGLGPVEAVLVADRS